MTLGVVHPGQMGVIVATSARTSGSTVLWASEGRSNATRARADQAGLTDAGSLAGLCGSSDVVISVCPPETAEAVARDVLACGFRGTYVDANAISPDRVSRMAQRMEAAGIDFVDGGIIGLPSLVPGETWLHLSGPGAAKVAACFAGGPVAVDVMDAEVGRASALKMCYAAYSKGSTALASAVVAAAERLGVRGQLARQWDAKGPGTARVQADILRAAPKAWRWVAEMDEISATLESAGVPSGFHRAAGEMFERLREFKNAESLPFEDVLRRLGS